MGPYACISTNVEVLNVALVSLGDHSTVSQFSYLCAATHDFDDPSMPVVSGPIRIGHGSWVCADVFVGPNVTVGDNSVVSARATVFDDIPPDTIAAGNPAKPIRRRG
jgi:putative colanic acid biosynthesis acetyltransferase WcaF